MTVAVVVVVAGCRSGVQESDRVAACQRVGGERCLTELLATGDSNVRARALDALVAMRSKEAVRPLLSALLNTLQTGGDGKEIAAKLAAIDPGAVGRFYDETFSKAAEARKAGAAAAAEQYIENAKALSKLAGGGDLSGEDARIVAMKKARRHADLAGQLVDALENGQLSRSYEIAKKFVEETNDPGVGTILWDLEKLSSLEDKFYATAQEQEAAKTAFEAAKASEGKLDWDKAGSAYQSAKNRMVLIRRALEKERKKLPILTEKVREAVVGYLRN